MQILYLIESILGNGKNTSKGNYSFFCPKCKHHKRKLEINLNPSSNNFQKYNCWVCSDFKGKTIRSLFKKLQVPQLKIDELNRIIKPSEGTIETSEEILLPKEFISLTDNKTKFSNRATQYLTKRGINYYDIIKYNIGFCSEGKYQDRIIIPSYDEDHNLNYFTARSINDTSTLKYLNPKIYRSNIIPFEFYINWSQPLIICEGPFDAISIKRNVIPLLGKTFPEALMKKIVTSQVKKIYLALDKDATKQSLKYIEMLLKNNKEVYLVEMDMKDASELGFYKFTELIQNTLPITFEDLLIKKLQQ